MRALCFTSQKDRMTLEQYLDKFLNHREIVEECGGNAGLHPGLINAALEEVGFDLDYPLSIRAEDRKSAERDTKEAYLAYVFLSNANKIKFAPLLRELANAYLHGNNEYPQTITAAHKLLVRWEGGSYAIPGPSNDGSAYNTLAEGHKEKGDEEGNALVNTSSKGGKLLQSKCGNIINCYFCGRNHYANMCNQKKEDNSDKKKKGGHMHLTTKEYNENEVDEDYGH
eukprot:5412648-Ditylum_brightwellii.AAC.1